MSEQKLVRAVLLSGGMDSTTLLNSIVRIVNDEAEFRDAKYKDHVYAIGFDYGQRHVRELRVAAKQAELLGVPYKVIPMQFMRDVLSTSVLTGDDAPVPSGMYDAANMAATVVPNRNMIMLSIAAGWAESLRVTLEADAAHVYTAVHAGDHAIYPDCRPDFIATCARTISLATDDKVNLHAPFVRMTKQQIYNLGCSQGTNYSLTHTCYNGNEIHCGRCGTCVERIEAVIQTNWKPDTIFYDAAGLNYAIGLLIEHNKIAPGSYSHLFLHTDG